MSLGKPAISPLRDVDLRSVQNAIASTRQRIEAIEDEVRRVAAQAGQTAFAGSIGASTTSAATTAGLVTALTSVRNDLADATARIAVLEAAPPSTAATDSVLYDSTGRALLSSTGTAILIGT